MRLFSTHDHDHTIMHGDVLEALALIDADSINLIFADPPYNIGKYFSGVRDNRDEADYLQWCKSWIDECKRILSPTGTFYLMASTQMMPHLDLYCRQRFEVLSRIVWTYDSSSVQARKYYGSMWEPILHMVTNKNEYVFNANNIEVEARTGAIRKLIDYRKKPPQPYNKKKVPGNVWDFSRVRFRMDEYEDHPSQKPEALLERVIVASSKPGDLILDPFSGTFSTCAVAAKQRRRSIGIEINDAYVKIGLRRVGIPSDYSEDELTKVKSCKTKNK